MIDEDLDKLADKISERHASPGISISDLVLKSIFGFLLSLGLAGTVWLISTTTQIDKKMGQSEVQIQNIQREQASYKQDMLAISNKLYAFTREPRYDQDYFTKQLNPIEKSLKRNYSELVSLRTKSRGFDDRLLKNETKYDLILENMADLKAAVKLIK